MLLCGGPGPTTYTENPALCMPVDYRRATNLNFWPTSISTNSPWTPATACPAVLRKNRESKLVTTVSRCRRIPCGNPLGTLDRLRHSVSGYNTKCNENKIQFRTLTIDVQQTLSPIRGAVRDEGHERLWRTYFCFPARFANTSTVGSLNIHERSVSFLGTTLMLMLKYP